MRIALIAIGLVFAACELHQAHMYLAHVAAVLPQ